MKKRKSNLPESLNHIQIELIKSQWNNRENAPDIKIKGYHSIIQNHLYIFGTDYEHLITLPVIYGSISQVTFYYCDF